MSKNKMPNLGMVKEILDAFGVEQFDNKKYKTRKPKQNKPKYHTQYDYTLQDIANASEKEQIKLANHFMAVMNQRLRMFEKKGYQDKSEWYQRNINRFVTRGENMTANKRAKAIQQMQRELNRGDATTRGYESIREKILKTLHDPTLHGNSFSFVTEENLDQWGEFMDFMREASGDAITYYDVDELQELWNIYDEYGAYSEEFQEAFDSFMNSPTTSLSDSYFHPNEYNT